MTFKPTSGFDALPEHWDAYVEDYAKAAGPKGPFVGITLAKANSLRPFSTATGILDNGCGTGNVITGVIEDQGSDIPASARLIASDYSSGMVAYVEKLKESPGNAGNPLWQRLETHVLDARDLSPAIPSGSLSHVLSSLVLMGVPDESKAVGEAYRVLEDGGVFVFTVLVEIPWIKIWKYAKEVAPNGFWTFDIPEVWRTQESRDKLLKEAGFGTVENQEMNIPMKHTPDSLRTYIRDFIGSQNPLSVQTWGGLSGEELDRAVDLIVQGTVKEQGTEDIVLLGKIVVVSARK